MKFCLKCDELIKGDVVEHIILDCNELRNKRAEFVDSKWFHELNRISRADPTNRHFYLAALSKDWNFKVMKMFSMD